ncbi:hypothetical protein NE237_022009 [Protea cynaroides]|uniref:Protein DETOXIFICATION n=1 Tax=Protea cynaroides TaxID=273540 RepID=A0A9Q0HA74_9MAGN|nr:hypothetical protein NE237_022009 [Protea cynaroides]
MDNGTHPLLISNHEEEDQQLLRLRTVSFTAEGDIEHINGLRDFFTQFGVESKKLWNLAGPAIFTSICQYTLGSITQVFAGHVGTVQLAAFSVENSVIAGFSYGAMLGMGSALETLCGQAFGAGQLDMLGIYMQRSWAQSKIMVMALISAVALVIHTFFSWLLMLKLGWGLAGAAIMLNFSWWFVVVAQLIYIFSGTCGRAWSGFSWMAFQNLWGFVRLSLASAVMLCLEVWYYTALILFAGYLKNAKIAVDAISICMNILCWVIMLALGFNAAISVRVSNELGAGHPRTAKLSVAVVVVTSFLVGLVISLILVISKNQWPIAFSSDTNVRKLVSQLAPWLAVSIFINNVQPVLSGVAIGAGWQALVAYVNIGCYYIFGIPLGLIFGYKIGLGVIGIWGGMLCGTILQTCVLFFLTYKTNWNKEASIAEDRIRQWGGEIDEKSNDTEK